MSVVLSNKRTKLQNIKDIAGPKKTKTENHKNTIYRWMGKKVIIRNTNLQNFFVSVQKRPKNIEKKLQISFP